MRSIGLGGVFDRLPLTPRLAGRSTFDGPQPRGLERRS